MKPKIEIREINRVTVGVFVGDEEKARFTGKDRYTKAEDMTAQLFQDMKPKGGLWSLKRGDKVIVEHTITKNKHVGMVCGGSTETKINLKSDAGKFRRSDGLQRGSMANLLRIYINAAEVAEIEAAEARANAERQASDEAESLKRAQERAADPRTPLLDKFYESTPNFYNMTLEQLQQIDSWQEGMKL